MVLVIIMLDLILTFMIFAIIGYVAEVSYVYINRKIWVNRGYLNGPYIPIYAFGSILTIIFLTKYYNDILIVFFMGIIITSALEYYTSYFMEKIFNRRWWDYSQYKYNLNGRITLLNSILFGIGCLVIIYFLSPVVKIFLNNINTTTKLIIAIVFIIIFIIDLVFSTIDAYQTSKNIILINKFNQKQLIKNIKTRILKAYPYLTKNNEELIDKIQKFKTELKAKARKLNIKK